MRFLIWAWDYDESIGGSVALHSLANNLTLLGQEALLVSRGGPHYPETCRQTKPGWGGIPTPFRYAKDTDIAIYPEITEGNPFRAKRVVRWILNVPNPAIIGPQDLVMQWDPKYNDGSYRQNGILTAWRDYSHFQNLGLPRRGNCYAVRKGGGVSLDQHSPADICIDKYKDSGGDDYLIRTFNTSEKFICYDNSTMLVVLAALCGCLVVIIPAAGLTGPPEWHFSSGAAWGWDDISRAEATLPFARLALDKMQSDSAFQTIDFVELCRHHWPN